jgi:hypothetical protein
MLRIKDRMMVPQGLYDYTVKETGERFESHGLGMLMVKVKEHMEANNLPIPKNLGLVIEEDWCSRRQDYCQDEDAPRPRNTSKDEWGSLSALISKVAIGGADALAKISSALGIHCVGCQRRHRIIKEMKRLGFTETLKRLKETFNA